jgi:hypothetical protein
MSDSQNKKDQDKDNSENNPQKKQSTATQARFRRCKIR